MKRLIHGASILALMAAAPALAQDQQPAGARPDVMVLSDWSYDPLYTSGMSVERMFDDTEVVGAGGEEIGDIENVIFSNDGKVLAIIAEVGGFWDIGDTHVAIPWDQVEFTQGLEQVRVPVTEETVDDYSVFGENVYFYELDADTVSTVDDDLVAGPGVFKATDLIGDYAFLDADVRYGYVNDVLIDRDGQISAIVVDSAAFGRPGFYAYPYWGYGVRPGSERFDLPYGRDEVGSIEEFDYERLVNGQS